MTATLPQIVTGATTASGTLVVSQPLDNALGENWFTWNAGAIIRIFNSPIATGKTPAQLFDSLTSTGKAYASVVNCWDASTGKTLPDFHQTLVGNV